MRAQVPIIFIYLLLSSAAAGQTLSVPAFLSQVPSAAPEEQSMHSITLDGVVQRYAGSLHESGNIKLIAKADGSANVELSLPSGQRTEVYGPFSSRSCIGTNERGKTYKIELADCLRPFPWFSPSISHTKQMPGTLPVNITDAGLITDASKQYHELDYNVALSNGTSEVKNTVSKLTFTRVFYDPGTLFPLRTEFDEHPSGNLAVKLHVRIEYSSYQLVSGIPVPYQINKYVNNTLQLSIVINAAVVD
jgi:hypothetical protein